MGVTQSSASAKGGDGFQDVEVVKSELSRVNVDRVTIDLSDFKLKGFSWRSNASLFWHVQVGPKLIGHSEVGAAETKRCYNWDRFVAKTKLKPLKTGSSGRAKANEAAGSRNSPFDVAVNLFLCRSQRLGSTNDSSRQKRKRSVLGYVSIPLLRMISGPELYDHAVFGCKYAKDYRTDKLIDLDQLSSRPSAASKLGRLSFKGSVKVYSEWAIQFQTLICEFPSQQRQQNVHEELPVPTLSSPSSSREKSFAIGDDATGSGKRARRSARFRRSIEPGSEIDVMIRTLRAPSSAPDTPEVSPQLRGLTLSPTSAGRAGVDIPPLSLVALSSPQTDRSSYAALPSASHDDSSGWANYMYWVKYSLIEHGEDKITLQSSESEVEVEEDANGLVSEAVLWESKELLQAETDCESIELGAALVPSPSRRRDSTSFRSQKAHNASLPAITQIGSFIELSQLGALRFELFRRSKRKGPQVEMLVRLCFMNGRTMQQPVM